MISTMRRNSCHSAVILPASTKEIEFVVPPSAAAFTSGSRHLTPNSRSQATLTPGYAPGGSQSYNNSRRASGASSTGVGDDDKSAAPAFVNKGWTLLQDVFASSSTSLNVNGGRPPSSRSSRSASISVSTLGLNRVQSSSNLMPRMNTERRASTNSIFLTAANSHNRRSRSHSKGSIYMMTPPNRSPATSAPGSRKNSKPSIFIEPAPEIVGNAQLGGLDPSLYLDPEKIAEKTETFPENHLGRLYFSITYDHTCESLSVLVKKIRNLPKHSKDAGIINKTYVKICLLPDERSQRRCSPSSDTFADLNPTFNETFLFQVSPSDLLTRSLRLLVYNIDVNRKHRVLGQTIVEMDQIDFSQGRMNLTSDLEKYVKTNDSDLPEILLSICFNATISRLTVNIVECKNLRPDAGTNPPDTYIKIQLMHQAKELKRKKTSIVKKDDSPQFQESFNFRIEEDEFDQAGLRVTCMQQQALLEKDRVLGTAVLGGFMFARGSGHEHWEDIKQYQKQHIQRWHVLHEPESKDTGGGGGRDGGNKGEPKGRKKGRKKSV